MHQIWCRIYRTLKMRVNTADIHYFFFFMGSVVWESEHIRLVLVPRELGKEVGFNFLNGKKLLCV